MAKLFKETLRGCLLVPQRNTSIVKLLEIYREQDWQLELLFDSRGRCRNIRCKMFHFGRFFTTTIVSLNIPEGVLFTDFVKRLKNDRCFHELN